MTSTRESFDENTSLPGDLLQDLFSLLSPATGHDFFRSLVDHLCTVCGVDFASVGQIVDRRAGRVGTLAFSERGRPLPDVVYQLAGTPCENVVAKKFCFYEEAVGELFPEDRMLVEQGITSYMGTLLLARDGTAVGVLAVMHRGAMADPARLEQVLRVLGGRTAAEVERSLALESLQASEARLAAVLDGSPRVAVQWYDGDGRVLRWNRASEQMFGYSADEALGKTLDQLIQTPEEFSAFLALLSEIRGTGQPSEPAEYPFRRRGGGTGTCWSTVFPIPGENGQPWFVCMDVDVTERKQLEEQMRQAQKLESLGVLAGGVAHDFNNLLTSILGHASLLTARLPADSTEREMLGQIESTARRAAELTRQMLAYAGRGRFVVQPLCLASLVAEMARLLHAVVSKKVEFGFELKSATVCGDATQIGQVVMNLITNASDAVLGEPGAVVVRTGVRTMAAEQLRSNVMQADVPAGSYAFLEVEDNGCGMTPATLERIFEPFFTTKFTGRGLGLAAVLGIVRSHGGLIQVDTAVGRGSRFTVLLPAHVIADGEVEAAHVVPANTGTVESALPVGGVVLLIDDEEDVRRVTRRVLEHAGFTVIEAADGPAGLEVAAANRAVIEVALIDLTMPRMDGWQVASRLREVAPGVPRVLMSGYSDPRTETGRSDATADAFVQKPFRASDLSVVLRRAIASARGKAP